MITFAEREQKRYLKCLDEYDSKVARLLYLGYELLPRLDYSEVTDERPAYDVYRSAASRILGCFDQSYAIKLLCSAMGLNEVAEKLHLYAVSLNDYARAMKEYRENATKWNGWISATRLTESEGQQAELYASLKTWKNETEMARFESGLHDYVHFRTEIWLLGPIKLFLSLSEESLVLVVERFVLPGLSAQGRCGDVVQSLVDLRDLVAQSWNEGVIGEARDLLAEVDEAYLKEFVQAERSLRSLMPTEAAKKQYVAFVEEQKAA